MPPERETPGSPQDWLRHARSDLAYACVETPVDGLLEVPCFHAQQAAEKSLKAVLVAYGEEVPRTHNLKTLTELLGRWLDVPGEIVDAAYLTDYAVATRYPGASEPIDNAEYEEALRLSSLVLKWASATVGNLES